MESLRVGGIISGLDTNGIVETYTKQARIPIERLESKYDITTLEKKLYTSIDSDLDTIKKNLLNLRLENTFKTKSLTSSNSSILAASSSVSAEVGAYSVEVVQTAKQSHWSSSYTSISGVTAGAGVTSISGTPSEHMEGMHSIAVDVTSSPKTVVDTFTPENLGQMTKLTGTANITNLDADGELTATLTDVFSITVDSTTFNYTLNAAISDDINSVMNDIEIDLNSQLNTHFGTTDMNYIAMRADYSGGNWNTSIYKTSLESFTIDSIGYSGGSNELGIDTTATSSSATISKYYVDIVSVDLLAKINDSSSALIRGVSFDSTSGLVDGTIELLQDSSLNTSSATYSQRLSNTVSVTAPLDTAIAGLQNAGTLNTADSNLNGTFTINDVEITINDYTTLSVNDVLALINSSNAEVTATYNSTDDKIVLTSNTTGANSITLGDYSDDSSFLSVFRLSTLEGSTSVTGTDSGSIDPTSKLSSAGFSNTLTSGIFTINNVSIYVDTSVDSLNDVIDKVNNSGAGVTMTYDSSGDKVTIKSDDKEKITFGSAIDTSSFLVAAKLTDSITTEKTLGFEGQDAIIKVNDVTYLRSSNKIDDVITGVTLNLNSASSETVNINISIDNTKGINAMASFIQQYNEMMTLLNPPELSDDEEEYLTALTDDDKTDMTSDEITAYNENWEEYNEYELIRKSSELRSLRKSMRSTATASLVGSDSKFLNLSQIGIDIVGGTDFETLNKGMLQIDSTNYDEILESLKENTTFTNNLENFSDDIYKFFAQNDESESESDSGVFEAEGKGWAKVYENHINRHTDDDASIGIKIKSGGTLDDELDRILKDYESQESRVEQYLERLWAQFAAMETTIASIQEQSASLTSLSGS